jgi:hypothetical protein
MTREKKAVLTAPMVAEALIAEFPELRDDPFYALSEGLLHLQVATLSHHTEAAIESGDLAAVRRHFAFVDRMLADADEDVDNAIHVSYLEHLLLDGEHGAAAEALLTARLREGWRMVHGYTADDTQPGGD